MSKIKKKNQNYLFNIFKISKNVSIHFDKKSLPKHNSVRSSKKLICMINAM